MVVTSRSTDIRKVGDKGWQPTSDQVAAEEPLEIRVSSSTSDGRATRSISITMRTPGDDNLLAAGFLFTEGIIRQAADVAGIETCGPPAPDTGNYNVIRVDLRGDVDVDYSRLQRHFYTTSSCGVCGKASLDALRSQGLAAVRSTAVFDRKMLMAIPGKLRARQGTFDETGGLHAAAAFDCQGRLLAVYEDIGRHNAVDKIVGFLLLNDHLPGNELGLIVSGRASFELTQKTLVAGMPLLAAISAPSSLAVSLAKEFDMTLIGFLRGDTFNIYAGEQRICT